MDDIVTVSEDEIASAVMLLLEREKVLAEGAGAAAFAAVLAGKTGGKNVTAVVSGGNIDMNFLSRVLERALVREGRIVNLKVVVPDRPGIIAELTKIIAKQGANIMHIEHDRMFGTISPGQSEVEFALETRSREHVREVTKALASKGFRVRAQE